VSQVEVNILTGETTILQTDIIYDCGQSLNPAVDLGQVCLILILWAIYIVCVHARIEFKLHLVSIVKKKKVTPSVTLDNVAQFNIFDWIQILTNPPVGLHFLLIYIQNFNMIRDQ